MAVLSGVVYFLKDHPSILVLGFVAYCVIFYISLMFTKSKAGKNPFYWDTRKPVRDLIHDKAQRDKVLKQGFTQKRLPDKIDAIVIGSGISGMTTAALLAKAGKRVLILEQHDQAGGCCHSFVEKGFEFDSGIHYIGEMQHRTLGRTLFEQITDGQVQWAPLDQNFDTVALGKPEDAKRYPLLSGKDEFRQSLVDSFPGEVEAIDKYFATLKKCRSLFLYFVMLKTLPERVAKWVLRLRLLDLFTNYGKYSNMTTQSYLDSITDNAELKAVLAYCYGDYGTSPRESSILMHALLLNHFSFASSYPVGGASEIAMQIIPVIERSMGRVLVRANVTDIIMEKGKAVGVRVSKGEGPIEIRAPIIISAAGIPNTMKLLPKDAVASSSVFDLLTDGRVKSGVGALSLFVGLQGTTEELGLRASNLWAFTESDLSESFERYIAHQPDIDNMREVPLLFVSFPSTKDPTWEEKYPGKSVCTVVTLANWNWFSAWKEEKVMHRGDDYMAVKDAFSEQIWSQVLKFYPQLADKVEYMELGSPVTNNYYIGSTLGEIYGLDHNKHRFNAEVAAKLRPRIGIRGLYLTGQDILTCGFSGGLFSGLLTASAVLRRDLFKDCMKLHQEIKKNEKTKQSIVNGYHKTKDD